MLVQISRRGHEMICAKAGKRMNAYFLGIMPAANLAISFSFFFLRNSRYAQSSENLLLRTIAGNFKLDSLISNDKSLFAIRTARLPLIFSNSVVLRIDYHARDFLVHDK